MGGAALAVGVGRVWMRLGLRVCACGGTGIVLCFGSGLCWPCAALGWFRNARNAGNGAKRSDEIWPRRAARWVLSVLSMTKKVGNKIDLIWPEMKAVGLDGGGQLKCGLHTSGRRID